MHQVTWNFMSIIRDILLGLYISELSSTAKYNSWPTTKSPWRLNFYVLAQV